MEGEKYHDLLSVSWRTRKGEGVIQFECKGLRTGSTKARGQEKVDVPAQRRANSPFLGLFVLSIQVLKGLDDAHPHW